jgi:hypothetical protein
MSSSCPANFVKCPAHVQMMGSDAQLILSNVQLMSRWWVVVWVDQFWMGRSKQGNVLKDLKNVLESNKMYFVQENVLKDLKNVLENVPDFLSYYWWSRKTVKNEKLNFSFTDTFEFLFHLKIPHWCVSWVLLIRHCVLRRH